MQDSIDHCLPDLVIVLCFEIDAGRVAVEGLAAVTIGNIFAVVNIQPKDLLIAKRADFAFTDPLASSQFPAIRTSNLSRDAADLYRTFGCFLASMPVPCLLSREKTQLVRNRYFYR